MENPPEIDAALGLVIANIAILLAGSLWGLVSYSGTMKRIHRKVEEQSAAEVVRQSVTQLRIMNPGSAYGDQPLTLRQKLEATRHALAAYKSQLRNSPKVMSQSPSSSLELGLVEDMEIRCANLDNAITVATKPTENTRTPDLLDPPLPVSSPTGKLEIRS